MEPLKIQIELTVEDKVLAALKHVTSILAATKILANAPEATKDFVETLANDASKPSEAPSSPEAEEAPVETVEAAPAPVEAPREVSDDEMTDFIREWRTKAPSAEIKKVFAKYGCTCSTGCPKEQRAAMMEDIKALAHA